MRVLIVGAGIGGLTLAALLRRWHIEPDVIDRAPSFDHAGYMLGLYPLGSRILHGLSAFGAFAAASEPMDYYSVAIGKGEVINRYDLGAISERSVRSVSSAAASCSAYWPRRPVVHPCAWASALQPSSSMAARCWRARATARRAATIWWWGQTAFIPPCAGWCSAKARSSIRVGAAGSGGPITHSRRTIPSPSIGAPAGSSVCLSHQAADRHRGLRPRQEHGPG